MVFVSTYIIMLFLYTIIHVAYCTYKKIFLQGMYFVSVYTTQISCLTGDYLFSLAPTYIFMPWLHTMMTMMCCCWFLAPLAQFIIIIFLLLLYFCITCLGVDIYLLLEKKPGKGNNRRTFCCIKSMEKCQVFCKNRNCFLLKSLFCCCCIVVVEKEVLVTYRGTN